MTTLEPGARGPDVVDLVRRLNDLGFSVPRGTSEYDDVTTHAVREFQRSRGLYVDGVCGPETWDVLLESAWSLGDRLLFIRSPMIRGDDVEELQHRLNALGFDSGREDGTFGPRSLSALREFQRNAGIAVDGICGPATLLSLRRLGALAAGSIARVRELDAFESLIQAGTALRVATFAERAMSILADVATRRLAEHGAEVLMDASGPADPDAAAEANAFGADICLALRVSDHPGLVCRYFGTSRSRSEIGLRLAESMVEEFSILLPIGTTIAGTNSMLRATSMPSVVCEFPRDAIARLNDDAAIAGSAIAAGLQRALHAPATR